MDNESGLVRRIAIVAAVLGTVAALYGLVTVGPWAAISSATGTAVGTLNVAVLARIITQLFDRRAEAVQMRAGIFLILKTALLFGLVGLIVTRPFILGGWFTVGITMSVFGVIFGGLWGSPPSSGGPTDSDQGTH